MCQVGDPLQHCVRSDRSEIWTLYPLLQIKMRFHSISFGVPQGSVLGPIMFLLYVNDLPNVSKSKTTLFADDTNLYLSHSNISLLQAEVLQEMTEVDSWLRKNKLSLNYNKSCYMIIGNRLSKKNTFNLTINNNAISQSNTVKYLSVILDNNLTWQPHIDKISEKLFKSCGMVFKLLHYVPLSTLKLIYYGMFVAISSIPPQKLNKLVIMIICNVS